MLLTSPPSLKHLLLSASWLAPPSNPENVPQALPSPRRRPRQPMAFLAVYLAMAAYLPGPHRHMTRISHSSCFSSRAFRPGKQHHCLHPAHAQGTPAASLKERGAQSIRRSPGLALQSTPKNLHVPTRRQPTPPPLLPRWLYKLPPGPLATPAIRPWAAAEAVSPLPESLCWLLVTKSGSQGDGNK